MIYYPMWFNEMLRARPRPVGEEGSVRRERIRSIGHGSVIGDYILDRGEVH